MAWHRTQQGVVDHGTADHGTAQHGRSQPARPIPPRVRCGAAWQWRGPVGAAERGVAWRDAARPHVAQPYLRVLLLQRSGQAQHGAHVGAQPTGERSAAPVPTPPPTPLFPLPGISAPSPVPLLDLRRHEIFARFPFAAQQQHRTGGRHPRPSPPHPRATRTRPAPLQCAGGTAPPRPAAPTDRLPAFHPPPVGVQWYGPGWGAGLRLAPPPSRYSSAPCWWAVGTAITGGTATPTLSLPPIQPGAPQHPHFPHSTPPGTLDPPLPTYFPPSHQAQLSPAVTLLYLQQCSIITQCITRGEGRWGGTRQPLDPQTQPMVVV